MSQRAFAALGALACTTILAGFPAVVHAVDGVKLIDQARALAGNVTPGDTPGFPVTISVSGSYQLSGDLSVPADLGGILVTAENVMLNLNGFNIVGAGGNMSDGIKSNLGTTTVVNGTVRGMGGNGLALATMARVDRVTARTNGLTGIQVGSASVVTGSTAADNGSFGILAGSASVISGNTTFQNGSHGISASAGTVTGNASRQNAGAGIEAFNGSTVNGNSVTLNGGFGLSMGLSVGYMHNVTNINSGGTVLGGVSLGQNLCDGVAC